MTSGHMLETQVTGGSVLATRGGSGDLPDDLLREATKRLSLLGFVWAGLWSMALVANLLLIPHAGLGMLQIVPWSGTATVIATLCLALSVGFALYTRQLWCQPRLALDLSLGYEVVLALAIGIINQWYPRILIGRLSWLCVLILLFPMIVPNTPKKTLVASLIAASMDPVGVWIASLRGLDTPSVPVVLWAYFPNYMCALLAVIPSHIVTRLGRQVRRARELGSYQLRELIGRGGMGEVWRATHRLLARPAAIKLIKPEFLGPGANGAAAMQRFRREAEAAAQLQSPHTIHIYDVGITRDGTFYFAMELLDGLDLQTLVTRHGPQPPARVVHVLRQACHSLAEAHERGLIHRDVKPANLFLCRMGLEHDFVKVLDFGLVKYDGEQSMLDSMRSGNDVVTTGTPAYMAPEIAAGGEPIDRRADIYALGCVGYWLLTGELVFSAETPLQMIIQHVQAEPVPPSLRSGRPVPPELEALVMECLRKDPAGRPASAEEVARRLAAVPLADSWTEDDARDWWNRHRPPVPQPAPEPEECRMLLAAMS